MVGCDQKLGVCGTDSLRAPRNRNLQPARRARRSHYNRGALALLAQTADARAVGLANLDDSALEAAVRAEAAIGLFLRHRETVRESETLAALYSVAGLVAERAT